jgi:enoyl-CoA hydratase
MTDGLMLEAEGIERFTERWHRTYDAIETCRKPTIAAVHGIAVAGGFELLQVTDFAVIADDARLADYHARYGLVPGGGSTQRLPRLIGERRAKWLLMSGEWISPAEALESGLANEVVPAERVLERAHAMAELLASRSPLLNAMIKRTVRLGMRVDLATALALERPAVVAHMGSEDARIGIDAFRTRDTPKFVGR